MGVSQVPIDKVSEAALYCHRFAGYSVQAGATTDKLCNEPLCTADARGVGQAGLVAN